jgi:hypothetical protein
LHEARKQHRSCVGCGKCAKRRTPSIASRERSRLACRSRARQRRICRLRACLRAWLSVGRLGRPLALEMKAPSFVASSSPRYALSHRCAHSNSKHAAFTRQVLHIHFAPLRLDRLAGDGEPQPQTSSIGIASYPGSKQLLLRPRRHTATVVFNLQDDVHSLAPTAQDDTTACGRELEAF